jgi:hypothetical protein
LLLGSAARIFHLQSQRINAYKIRARVIERKEGGDFERQTLFIVSGSHLAPFDNYLAALGSRNESDGRQRARRSYAELKTGPQPAERPCAVQGALPNPLISISRMPRGDRRTHCVRCRQSSSCYPHGWGITGPKQHLDLRDKSVAAPPVAPPTQPDTASSADGDGL